MGARTTKTASNGSKTECPKCGKAVRGQKGLKAHTTICTGTSNKKKEQS